MVETALIINPSLCVPLGHNPSVCRRMLLCIRPGHIFLFVYNQINLKCLQPDLWNTRSSWTISEQHISIFGSNATLHILIFLRFLLSSKDSVLQLATGVTTNQRIQKKEREGNCALRNVLIQNQLRATFKYCF